ncbi:MAG: hypothetical protein K8J08_17645 [Thermoanaerobaculia bacterium]|nr:hypothetical protein [Thermoanaerobaculia bacterium]
MKKFVIVSLALMSTAGLVWGELPAEKTRELNAAGITDWQPGQNAGQQEKFRTLANPLAVPAGPEAPDDTATMQYDNGTISALPTVFGGIYGNRFSQGVGGVSLSTITLNSFSFYFAEDSLPDDNMFFQVASTSGATGMINARASANVLSLINAGTSFSMLTTINVVPQSVLVVSSAPTTGMFSNTFFLGAWCLNSNTAGPGVTNEAIGLATNVGGGFRGYTAVSGTGPVAMAPGSFQAVLRANITSPNAVPVELMSFGVAE